MQVNEAATAAKPKAGSRRMVVWMIAVPIVVLLLALAGANWKTFHLAYAKHLIASDGLHKQHRGVHMVLRTHLRMGMSLEEVRAKLAPASVTEVDQLSLGESPPLRGFIMSVKGSYLSTTLGFDENDRLRHIEFSGWVPLPPK